MPGYIKYVPVTLIRVKRMNNIKIFVVEVKSKSKVYWLVECLGFRTIWKARYVSGVFGLCLPKPQFLFYK